MFSFRSILLAAAAFATVASAIPTPDAGGVTNALTPAGLTSGSPAVVPAPARRGQSSGGDIIKKCHDDIAVVVLKIDAVVKVDGGAKNVKHDVVIDLLWDIVAILRICLHDIKAIVKFELLLDGVACTLKQLAAVVVELLIIVIETVWYILSIVGWLDLTLCGVIATIGQLLCEILEAVFFLVEGLLVEVAVLIVPYGDHCKYVKYTDLLVLLKIVVR